MHSALALSAICGSFLICQVTKKQRSNKSPGFNKLTDVWSSCMANMAVYGSVIRKSHKPNLPKPFSYVSIDALHNLLGCEANCLALFSALAHLIHLLHNQPVALLYKVYAGYPLALILVWVCKLLNLLDDADLAQLRVDTAFLKCKVFKRKAELAVSV